MKRRDLLKSALGLTALASFSALRPALAADDWEEKGPAMPDMPLTKVSDRCYYIEATDGIPTPDNQGFFSNPGFVITQKGVVVFDNGGSVQIGEMLLRQIKTVTNKPVVMIFNSHIHGDHWFGNQAFVAAYPNVDIYCHPNIMRDIKAGQGDFWLGFMHRNTGNATAGTSITPPTKTVEGGEVFDMGDVKLKVHHFGKVHTDSDIALEIVEEKIMFTGDMAMRRIANMDDGSFPNSVKALEALANLNMKTYIPGHGNHDDKSLLDDQRKFYDIIYSAIDEHYDDGLTDFEIKPKIEAEPFMKEVASKWPGYDTTLGRFVSIAYQEYEANLF